MNIHRKIVLLTAFTYLFLTSAAIAPMTAAATTIHVDPPSILVLTLGETLSINVNVSNVEDLCAWEFKLYYRNNVLNATDVTEGPFLKTGGSTFFGTVDFNDAYNATYGRVWVTCTLLGIGPGVNGSGSLVTITFKTRGFGDAALNLVDTLLVDSGDKSIPHTVVDGLVQVGVHNIAITNVTLPTNGTYPVALFPITVTLKNKGNFSETFNVTAYRNNTAIQTQTILNLAPNTEKNLVFTWQSYLPGYPNNKSQAWPYPKHVIKVNSTTIPNEIDTTDNTIICDSIVIVKWPGDIDGDGHVDLMDLIVFAQSWFAEAGDPNYDYRCDFDMDGQVVLIMDLIILAQNWFKGPID